nr:hypothetical protein [Tanacetum cinerariifolium]
MYDEEKELTIYVTTNNQIPQKCQNEIAFVLDGENGSDSDCQSENSYHGLHSSDDEHDFKFDFEVHSDMKNSPAMKVHQKFSDVIAFRRSLNHYAIINEFEYTMEKSDLTRLTACCEDTKCEWRIHASTMDDNITFQVKKLVETHLCTRTNKCGNKRATQGWIANVIHDKIKSDRDISDTEIMKWLMTTYNVDVSYMRTYRGKEQAYTDIRYKSIGVVSRVTKKAIGTPNGLVISSDMQKGLGAAITQVYPDVEHRECMRLMYSYFKKQFRGDFFKFNIWGAANTYSITQHNRLLKEISKVRVVDMVQMEVLEMYSHQMEILEMYPHQMEIFCMVFNSPMLYLLRVEMIINSPWIMPILGTKELASPEQTTLGLASSRVSTYLFEFKYADAAFYKDIPLICADFFKYVLPTGRIVVPIGSLALKNKMTSSSSSCPLSFSTIGSIHHHHINDIVPPSSLSLHKFTDRSRSVKFTVKSSLNSGSGGDPFGFYPWESSGDDNNNGIEWERQETITLFTSDGLVQIGGLMVPKRVSSAQKKQAKGKTSPKLQQFKESNYMDPAQGLCLGALFDIAATNGLDTGRRLCIIGFCRSIEMLSDVVEDTVLQHGGEIVIAEKASKGGLHEKLSMTVAVPLLWGVPPASESLQIAVRSGGGIVDKVFWQWNF